MRAVLVLALAIAFALHTGSALANGCQDVKGQYDYFAIQACNQLRSSSSSSGQFAKCCLDCRAREGFTGGAPALPRGGGSGGGGGGRGRRGEGKAAHERRVRGRRGEKGQRRRGVSQRAPTLPSPLYHPSLAPSSGPEVHDYNNHYRALTALDLQFTTYSSNSRTETYSRQNSYPEKVEKVTSHDGTYVSDRLYYPVHHPIESPRLVARQFFPDLSVIQRDYYQYGHPSSWTGERYQFSPETVTTTFTPDGHMSTYVQRSNAFYETSTHPPDRPGALWFTWNQMRPLHIPIPRPFNNEISRPWPRTAPPG